MSSDSGELNEVVITPCGFVHECTTLTERVPCLGSLAVLLAACELLFFGWWRQVLPQVRRVLESSGGADSSTAVMLNAMLARVNGSSVNFISANEALN